MIKGIICVIIGVVTLLSTVAMWVCCKISGEADKRFNRITEREEK